MFLHFISPVQNPKSVYVSSAPDVRSSLTGLPGLPLVRLTPTAAALSQIGKGFGLFAVVRQGFDELGARVFGGRGALGVLSWGPHSRARTLWKESLDLKLKNISTSRILLARLFWHSPIAGSKR
jgi:hypothetical protein